MEQATLGNLKKGNKVDSGKSSRFYLECFIFLNILFLILFSGLVVIWILNLPTKRSLRMLFVEEIDGFVVGICSEWTSKDSYILLIE